MENLLTFSVAQSKTNPSKKLPVAPVAIIKSTYPLVTLPITSSPSIVSPSFGRFIIFKLFSWAVLWKNSSSWTMLEREEERTARVRWGRFGVVGGEEIEGVVSRGRWVSRREMNFG